MHQRDVVWTVSPSESVEDVTTAQGSLSLVQSPLKGRYNTTQANANYESPKSCKQIPPPPSAAGGTSAESHLAPGTQYHSQGERENHLKLTKFYIKMAKKY